MYSPQTPTGEHMAYVVDGQLLDGTDCLGHESLLKPCASIDKTALHKHNHNILFNVHLLPALHSKDCSWEEAIKVCVRLCVPLHAFARVAGYGCMRMSCVSVCAFSSLALVWAADMQ